MLVVFLGGVLLYFAVSFLWHWLRYTGATRKMIAAIERGNADGLRALVQKHRQLLVDDDYATLAPLLPLPVMMNEPECMKVLLELGDAAHLQVRVQETGEMGMLGVAVEQADPEMLRLLLKAGMTPGAEPEAPMLRAAIHGKVEHARVLVEFGGEVFTAAQRREVHGQGALHGVVYGWGRDQQAALAMLDYLVLEQGADINVRSDAGNTALDLAYDETHVGYEDGRELRLRLVELGGKRGRSLQVPLPEYRGRVFIAGDMPDLSPVMGSLPLGVRVAPHAEPWVAPEKQSLLKDSSLKDEVIAAIESHTCYVEVVVTGREGEDPVDVAERGCMALRRVAALPGVVGLQFQQFIGSRFHGRCSFRISPLNLVGARLGLGEDGAFLIGTLGMADYGLAEVEIVVPQRVAAKRKLNPFEPLTLVLEQLLEGVTGIEPGHTMTLCECFTRVEWGEHRTSGRTGFRIVMTERATPASYLQS